VQKKSSGDSKPRIPPEHGGIQVNFCKNPDCENYGIPAAQTTGRGARRDRYAVVGAGRQFPVLKCHTCGEYPPLKSNQGIAEERERLGAYLMSVISIIEGAIFKIFEGPTGRPVLFPPASVPT